MHWWSMGTPEQPTIMVLCAASRLSLPLGVWLPGLRASFWCSCLAFNPRAVWEELCKEKL